MTVPDKKSSRLTLSLTVLVVVAIVVSAVTAVVLLRGERGTRTETSITQDTGDRTGLWGPESVEVTLLEVIDGDTIWVRMSDGSNEKVRYIGIDAPELVHEDSPGEYLGEESKAHNAYLLAQGTVRLQTDIEERDDYGRLLAYVWAGDWFVNERMVLDGLARAKAYPPNVTKQDLLWSANDQARAAGGGIWEEQHD
jgi:endonuclease YncB( thermonuclease family)